MQATSSDDPSFVDRLVDSTADALIATDTQDRVCFWNPAAETLFGVTRDEALGCPLATLLQDSGVLGPDTQHAGESLQRRPDGSRLYVHARSRTLHGEAGAAIGQVHSCTDVTALKVERDAHLVRSRYRDVLESMPDAIVIVNEIGRIVFASSQAERAFGYAHEELLGQPIEMLMPPRYRATHEGHRDGYLARSHTRPMGLGLQLHGRRRNGDEFPVEISLSPLQTEAGPMAMSAIRDMTLRRKAEEKFRGLLESAPDAMVIVDQAGRITLVNTQTERLFGYPRAELLGQPVEVLVPEHFRGDHAAHRGPFFADPKRRAMGAGLQLHGRRRDGTQFPVEISLSPLDTEDGLLVSSSIRDISERRRVEQALHEKNLELERANQAKDRFLATMSHELRTPLNAVIGFTGLLLMRLPGPLTPDQVKQLGMVQSSAKHLLSLINDLLDLARIDSGNVQMQLSALDCRPVIEDVVATLRPAAQSRGLALELVMPEGELHLETDRRALQQILLNLVSNAIKFTDAGWVRVVAECSGGGAAQRLLLSVQDSGAGISADDQARLFLPFSRVGSAALAQPRAEGTGLGLYLCRKLAELLGGRLSLRSEPGRGSVFTLSLPCGRPGPDQG